jgi:23S rRNA pseudouridine1911/1915/1917 synthase
LKLEYTVTKEDENVKLKYILKNKLYISTGLLIKLKNNKCIFVNDNICLVNTFVKENDKILINLDNIENDNITRINSYKRKLNIIYEDEYILVIDKPSNLEVHPSANNYDKTLANMVINYYDEMNYNINKVHIITRLDKDTSGICIIAKNEYIQNLFSTKSTIQKEYIAIVNGIVKNDHDIIEKNISRKEGSIILRQVNDLGDYCKTEYFVLQRNIEKNYTCLKLLLHTGRTHQIRVHMAYLGHVLLRR